MHLIILEVFNLKRFILIILLLAVSSTVSARGTREARKTGLGFEYGISMNNYIDAHFRSNNTNFVKIGMQVDKRLSYYLHVESGTFSANGDNEGADASATVSNKVVGLGAKMLIGYGFSAGIMLGTATLTGSGDGTAVPEINQTVQASDFAIGWERSNKRITIATGVAYRVLLLPKGVYFNELTITDLSSANLFVSIKYSI
jgi:hypothetical protein